MDRSLDQQNPEFQILSMPEPLSNATTDTRHKTPEHDFNKTITHD
jgi:hypothetical protein